MERKQFKFTGLTWMKPEEILKVRKQLLKLEDYGIEFEFVSHSDTQLFIYDYDEVLQSPNDEDAVTFTKKFKNETEEDCLLIFTINDGMNVDAKMITYWGDVQEIQF